MKTLSIRDHIQKQCNSATVQQCNSATVQQCSSAAVQQCNSGTVQQAKGFKVLILTKVAKCETAMRGEKSVECEISNVRMRDARRSAQNRSGFRWMQTVWERK